MARNKTNPEGVFSDVQFDAIEGSLRTLCDRAVNVLSYSLTTDDLLDLLVAPQHHAACRTAVDLFDVEADTIAWFRPADPTMPGAQVCVNFHFDDDAKILLPKYTEGRISKLLVSAEQRAVVHDWLLRRMKIGRAYSEADAVFRWLHKNCATLNEAKFFAPWLVPLLDMHYTTTRDAAKMRDLGPPKHVKGLTMELRTACKAALATVTKGLLLPSKYNNESPVKLTIDTNYAVAAETGWGGRDVDYRAM